MNVAIIVLLVGIFLAIIIGMVLIVGVLYPLVNAKTTLSGAQELRILTERQRMLGAIPAHLKERIKVTNDLLDTIDGIVQTEVGFLIRSRNLIEKPYDLKSSDEDIKATSTKVMECLKAEVIVDKDLLISDAYIMEYIVSSVTLNLLQLAKEYNQLVRTR